MHLKQEYKNTKFITVTQKQKQKKSRYLLSGKLKAQI